MKWSTVLVVASNRNARDLRTNAGHRWTCYIPDRWRSSSARKRQSCQTTQTVPAPSTAAEGSGLPANACGVSVALNIRHAHRRDQVTPPFVELKSGHPKASIGTTTVRSLHQRLSPNAGRSIRGRFRGAPGSRHRSKCSSKNAVPGCGIVPLDNNSSRRTAGGGAVAHDQSCRSWTPLVQRSRDHPK